MVRSGGSPLSPTLLAFVCGVALVAADQTFHHRLTKRELHQVFGVDHHDRVPEYDLIRPEHVGVDGDDEALFLSFSAWNEDYRLHLRPNSRLVSPEIVTVIRDGKDSRLHDGLPYRSDCHYLGTVLSHGNASAAVSNCAYVRGAIVMPDYFLMLHPVPLRLRQDDGDSVFSDKHHVIFKRSPRLLDDTNDIHSPPVVEEQFVQLQEEFREFCDVNEISEFNYTVPDSAQLDSLFIFPQMDPLTLEIGLFMDSKLWEHFVKDFGADEAEKELLDFSLALINNVYVLYQQPTISPNLDVILVRYELWKTQPAGLETDSHKNGQAQRLLDGFCRHQQLINPGTDTTNSGHWDGAVLLTGYDIYHTTTSVAGVAPVARMCDEQFACALVEGLHLGRSFVLAHELGHNLGMVHDGVQNQCSRSCCLMSAVNGAGKTTWSHCSVREYNAYLLQLDEGRTGGRNCLRDNSGGLHTKDHRSDGRLPGQRFTGDEQCAFFWGRDYKVEIPAGRQHSDICRILWCGNSGSTISTAHPALEGTWCGGQQYCIEGQCRSWTQGTPPRIIDGGWSVWTSDELCSVDHCQITGSIRLRSQTRTCSDPAPNNGGRLCSGSHIRGMVCDSSLGAKCDGLTREEFGDRLCRSFLHDAARPDRQLSGKAFLHAAQPCKVWCHLSGSELIRNKAQFPEGSPCGTGKYCVGGSCLKLSCSGKAVVASSSDCPLGTAGVETSVSGSSWSSWSEFGACSATCGSGTQSRSRTCDAVIGTNSSLALLSAASEPDKSLQIGCEGAANETQPCHVADCPIATTARAPTWDNWAEWTVCSASCGGGTHLRTRSCSPPGAACDGSGQEQQACSLDPCPKAEWEQWGDWAPCSATCGNGQRIRRRACSAGATSLCDGVYEQRENCSEKTCPDEGHWGEWSSCSASCGTGFQSRDRICSGPACSTTNNKQARTCSQESCSEGFVWEQWSEWDVCSEPCGEGIQSRTRGCASGICPLGAKENTDSRRCVVKPCIDAAQWADWSQWSGCSVACGAGRRRRFRHCGSQVIGALIITDGGLNTANDCGVGEREELEPCEGKCDSASPIIPLLVTGDPIDGNSAAAAAAPTSASWTSWQFWTTCTATCNGGVRERVRECRGGGGKCDSFGSAKETQKCNQHPCDFAQWSDWGAWTECSFSCDGGRQTRERSCSAGSNHRCQGYSKEEKPCNTAACPSISQRSLPDSLSPSTIPQWSAWSTWSRCSCFGANQLRRRYCDISDPAIKGFCPGAMVEQRPCSPDSCESENGEWSGWGAWSHCSKDCGAGGARIRHRMCSEPIPANRGSYCIGYSFEQEPCPLQTTCNGVPVNGGWSEWSVWSACSDLCSNGQKTRTRYCSNPRPSNGGRTCDGSDFELQPCSDLARCFSRAGGWGSWTEWSGCGTACGFTFQSRNRRCVDPSPLSGGAPCTGLAYMTSICNTQPCKNAVDGGWTAWANWSACTGNCGYGSRTRKRLCENPKSKDGGYPCFGRSSEVEACTTDSSMCSPQIDNVKLLEGRSRLWEQYVR
uniref:Peptidase M12B domain-containing protein n=1 Tax=Plectus sambesii TaxID=2011161 RepID=A0A914VC25_9BILA